MPKLHLETESAEEPGDADLHGNCIGFQSTSTFKLLQLSQETGNLAKKGHPSTGETNS